MDYRELYVVRDIDLVKDKLKSLGKGIYLNSGEPDEVERYKKFKSLGIPHKFYPYKKTFELLGTTWDFAILDLSNQFVPNDIARAVETVRAGGKIVFLVPDGVESLKSKTFKFHRVMIPMPFQEKDLEHNFMIRFVETLKRHKNVFLESSSGISGILADPPRQRSHRISSRKPFNLCVTRDQEDALRALLEWDGKKPFILISDRGRGKSALMGIFAAWMIKTRKASRILATSPTESGIQVFFQFLEKALQKFGVKARRKSSRGIFEVSGDGFFVRYLPPEDAVSRARDLLIVDEASSIPVYQLKKLNRGKVIFATTVHGYEGHGRGFTLKFLKSLKAYQKFEMNEPIRYPSGDPIEAWLYDAFLLDVDLEEPRKDSYEKVDRKELVNDEEELRRYFSIYIWAHYKTDPNDIMISLDAPGKVLRKLGDYGVLEASYEGGLDARETRGLLESTNAVGNLIPDIILKHYGEDFFARNRGLRIVRIAIHPDHQGKGYGTRLIQNFIGEFSDLSWIGVSFGAEADLVRFWRKQGFRPVFISPTKSDVTGLYSLVMIRPAEESREVVKSLESQFKSRFVSSLPDTYRDMDPATSREILAMLKFSPPSFTEYERNRARRFLEGKLTYESVDDVARKLLPVYLSSASGAIPRESEIALVAKVMHSWTWEEMVSSFGKNDTYWIIEVKDSLRQVFKLFNI